MMQDATIRAIEPADHDTLMALYPLVFPDEDLTGVVRDLLGDDSAFSLVAEKDGALIGHVAFAKCDVNGVAVYLLGHLAVDPEQQRGGIGSALIKAGFEKIGDEIICVLGDPGYYGRFGFTQEDGIRTPYPIPDEWAPAWQSVVPTGHAAPQGTLAVSQSWQNPDYWGE